MIPVPCVTCNLKKLNYYLTGLKSSITFVHFIYCEQVNTGRGKLPHFPLKPDTITSVGPRVFPCPPAVIIPCRNETSTQRSTPSPQSSIYVVYSPYILQPEMCARDLTGIHSNPTFSRFICTYLHSKHTPQVASSSTADVFFSTSA